MTGSPLPPKRNRSLRKVRLWTSVKTQAECAVVPVMDPTDPNHSVDHINREGSGQSVRKLSLSYGRSYLIEELSHPVRAPAGATEVLRLGSPAKSGLGASPRPLGSAGSPLDAWGLDPTIRATYCLSESEASIQTPSTAPFSRTLLRPSFDPCQGSRRATRGSFRWD